MNKAENMALFFLCNFIFIVKVVGIMNDLIKILLNAEISEKSIGKIKSQIKDIENTQKIKINIDEEKIKNLKQISEELRHQSATPMSIKIDTKQATESMKALQNTTGEVGAISTKTWEDADNKVYKYSHTLQDLKKDLTIIDTYTKNKKGDFDFIGRTVNDQSIKNTRIEITKAHTEALKLNSAFDETIAKNQSMAQSSYWKQQFQDIGKTSSEIKRLNQYYSELEKTSQKIADFQKKMLTSGSTKGEMDTFSKKFKGRFDESEFSRITKEAKELQNIPLEKQTQAIKNLTIEWGNLKQTAMQSGSVVSRSIEGMIKFARFYFVGGMIVSLRREITDSIKFIKDLDKELTQVSVITGMTRDETLELAKSYGVLASEMGKTVIEISKVNTELVRQGLSLEESQRRMDTILKLSASADIETSQSMKIITSAVNALGEESERTADVMLKSANISASSVGEIGEAFTKTASSAKATGMELTELSAVLSTLIEVTQESPNSLGNSLKTLLSRFNRVNEETGEMNKDLNDVQKAFQSVGVAFMDSNKQIRPVYDLMNDLNKVWGNLDKNTKMYISTQAAGVRQQNRFLAIMDNFNRVQEINNELIDSGGTLTGAYGVYLDSVEASANKTKAALQEMWINTISSDSIKHVYDFTTAIVKLIDKVGLLNIVLLGLWAYLSMSGKMALFGSVTGLSMAFGRWAVSMGASTAAASALSTAMSVLLPFLAMGVVIGAIKLADKLTISLKDQQKIVREMSSDLEKLQSKYRELQDKEDKTEEELMYLALLNEQIEAQEILLEAETKRLMQREFLDSSTDYNPTRGIDKAERNLSKLVETQEKMNQALEDGDIEKYDELKVKAAELQKPILEAYEKIKSYIEILDEAPQELLNFVDSVEKTIVSEEDSADAILDVGDAALAR